MDEELVARLSFEDIELNIALEREDAKEYVTIFITKCKDGNWYTDRFLDDDEERNDKIKTFLNEENWNALKYFMFTILVDFCNNMDTICDDCIHKRVCEALIEKGLPYNDGFLPAKAFCMTFRNKYCFMDVSKIMTLFDDKY